jgi:hypothetical protein
LTIPFFFPARKSQKITFPKISCYQQAGLVNQEVRHSKTSKSNNSWPAKARPAHGHN